MRRLIVGLICLGLFVAAQPAQAQGDGKLMVTATYTGQGGMKPGDVIRIFLFETPDIGAGSMPITTETIDKNGGMAHFTDLPAATVYLAMVFDEKGAIGAAPPPSGTPVALHGPAGTAQAIPIGNDAKVTVTFDDSNRQP